MSLKDDLERLRRKERLSLHMPGHKGLRLPLDTTELPGTDNLQSPTGSLRALEDAIAEIYGTSRAYLGTNGSTGLLQSALLKAKEMALANRRSRGAETHSPVRILLARGVHLSIGRGVVLLGLEPIYLPNPLHPLGFPLPIPADRYLPHLENAEIFLFTSPTYEGYLEDYALLKPFLKDRPTILDAAHGAHLWYLKKEENLWMDQIVLSFHKTLATLNQGAVLLSNLEEDLRPYTAFFQTSSPSYPILLSMEDSIRELMVLPIGTRLEAIRQLKEGIGDIPGFRVLETSDPLKLLITGTKDPMDFKEVATWLREEEGIYFEMERPTHLLGILSLWDGPGGYRHLLVALRKYARTHSLKNKEERPPQAEGTPPPTLHVPSREYLPHEAWGRETELLPLHLCQGRVSGDFLVPYPPGVPLLHPGEVIDRTTIQLLKRDEVDLLANSSLKPGGIFVLKT